MTAIIPDFDTLSRRDTYENMAGVGSEEEVRGDPSVLEVVEFAPSLTGSQPYISPNTAHTAITNVTSI
jgi:hypothetical protein